MNKTVKFALVVGWAVAALPMANIAWAAAAPAPRAAAAAPKPTEPKPLEASGKIHAIDVVSQVIKMENGDFYYVPPSVNLSEFKEGDQITLSGDKDEFGKLKVKAVSKGK